MVCICVSVGEICNVLMIQAADFVQAGSEFAGGGNIVMLMVGLCVGREGC